MTDKKSFADRVGDPATGDESPHAYQAPERRSYVWPSRSCLRY